MGLEVSSASRKSSWATTSAESVSIIWGMIRIQLVNTRNMIRYHDPLARYKNLKQTITVAILFVWDKRILTVIIWFTILHSFRYYDV